MSVTTQTEPELGSDAALSALFADDPPPAPSGETPSPAEPTAAPPAPTGARAERATDPTGTDAAPPADSTEGTTDDATPARTTHPKSWKGTEEEWQAFRAEQNRATNRERDRAEALAKELREKEDREAFLTAQLGTRDKTLVDGLVDAYRQDWVRQYGDAPQSLTALREWASQKLKASQAEGNEGYWAVRSEQERQQVAEAQRQAEAQRSQQGADADAEANRQATYWQHYPTVATYAFEQGVTGLDLHALYGQAFTDDEIADDVEESRRPDISDERRERLVNRVYRRADAYVKAKVDAAAAAKTQAASAAASRPDTTAGRTTAVGGTAAGTGAPVPEFTAESFDREMTAWYAEQDRRDATRGVRRPATAMR